MVEPALGEAEAEHSHEAAAKVVASTEMVLGEEASRPHAATSLPGQLGEDGVRAKPPKAANICFLCLRQEALNVSPQLATDLQTSDASISASARTTNDLVLLQLR